MERREFLGAAPIGLLTAIGGCLSRGETPSVPEGVTVETKHWAKDVLKNGIWYQRQEGENTTSDYYTVVADENTANEEIIGGEEDITEFVRETDFEQSYLLIVQNMMQSARWLELQRIERSEDRFEVNVVTESPDGSYGDDATVHSLLVRVTDEEAAVPAELDVTIDGDSIDT